MIDTPTHKTYSPIFWRKYTNSRKYSLWRKAKIAWWKSITFIWEGSTAKRIVTTSLSRHLIHLWRWLISN